jgi:hypothetical protein
VNFDEALDLSSSGKRRILLGNGFRISLNSQIFSYGSLYGNADFSESPNVQGVFNTLGTYDFELVIRFLADMANTLRIYDPANSGLIDELERDSEIVKDALASAIARGHPSYPFDIKDEQYLSCREFLRNFSNIFTLNYDVLLYWTMMKNDLGDRDLNHDDGFRHPPEEPELPWVSWQQANKATVAYLHGALHLFDAGADIIKYTWSKTDIPLMQQIRSSLDQDRYPLFVAEGDSDSKRQRIMHSAYLHKAMRSFEECCKGQGNSIFVFGHSFAENDAHIFQCITKGNIGKLFVSLYGNRDSDENLKIRNATQLLADKRVALRGAGNPLEVHFYNAETAHVWS